MPAWLSIILWVLAKLVLPLIWPLLKKLLPWLPDNILEIIEKIIDLLKKQQAEVKGVKRKYKAARKSVFNGVGTPSDLVRE